MIPDRPREPDSFTLPGGFGMRKLNAREFAAQGEGLQGLFDLLLVFEPPRRRPKSLDYRYVLGVDTSDGLGLDRSICDVVRVGTLAEPKEQVAQFCSDSTSAEDFAPIVDAIGRWYADPDGLEAQAAIEINNHGLATQGLLQRHYGYANFYRWQYQDKFDISKRFSKAIGWETNVKSRKILLGRLMTALKTIDPVTADPDLIIHSPITFNDLADFYSPTGHLADAEATHGSHDDAVFSLAIANFAAEQLLIGESEPVADRRHRIHQEELDRESKTGREPRDWRNTDCTAGEMSLELVPDRDGSILTDDEVGELVEAQAYADYDS